MSKRFAAVENAADEGFEKTTPAAGAKLVDDWIEEVGKLDLPGAKGLHHDMARLETELRKESPDEGRVKTLLGSIGEATSKLADRCDDEKLADKVRSLGQALSQSA